MHKQRLERYREQLKTLLERTTSAANHVVESIQEDANPQANISNVPLHLADNATEALDADVRVLETERVLQNQIEAALARIDEGTFGKCQECGVEISSMRLDALPYTPYCIDCAKSEAGAL